MTKISSEINILLIDDSKTDRKFFTEFMGYSCSTCKTTECGTAEEGLSILIEKASIFDIVVVDQTLPGMTGLQFCQKIIDKGIDIPMVLLTGTGSEETAIKAMKMGFVDYIIKGSRAHREMLPEIIDEIIRKYRNRKELDETKKELLDSELRFKTIFDNAMDGILIADGESKTFTLANEAFCRATGYSMEELTGMGVGDIHPGEELPDIIEKFEKQAKNEIKVAEDIPVLRKDGSVFYADINSSPFTINGRTYLIGVFRDISGKKEKEQTLRKLSMAIEQSSEMVMITDPKGTIEYVNPAVTEITGYPRNELVGENSSILKSGAHPPEFYNTMWSQVAAGKVWHGTMINRKKSGELYHEEMTISPVKDDSGNITDYVAIKADITERKKIESALAEKERRLREVIETTSEGFWQIDLNAITTGVNSALCDMLGYSRDEMMGKHASFFADEENRKIIAAQTSKISTTLHRHFEISLKAKDGHNVPVVFNSTTFNDDEGNPAGGFSFVTDISEQKKNETALRKAKEEAEEATKLKDKFVALVSHDLKSPMTVIDSYLQMLKDAQDMPEQLKVFIDEAAAACDDMTLLVNEILNLSRIAAGKIKPNEVFLQTRDIIERATKNYAMMAIEKDLKIINDVPEKSRIYADERLILEVVRNLLSNAIKFSRKGGEIRAFIPDGELSTIAISDSGIGIDKERINQLFAYETKTSTRGTAGEAGTGFGLPLIRDIVEAHGGSIIVETEKEKGSTFFVRLPHLMPHILIIDDDESLRMLARKHLEGSDIALLEADRGEKALEMMDTHPLHMIMLDLYMPGMNGFEVLERIRENDKTKNTPVIIITADKNMQTIDRIFQLGADDFIVKPFNRKDIMSLVGRFAG